MNIFNKYGNSSWWLKPFNDDFENDFLSEKQIETKNLYKLAANRRAIANFVSIVTGKNIPVRFSQRGDSYTDGTTVVISSDITDPKDFDPAVGLALHEGSHIKLSDFELLQNLLSRVSRLTNYDELNELCMVKGIVLRDTLKDILNWVEDRRIDNFIFTNAPGYRDYYRALYDKYFNDPLIDKGIQSDDMSNEEIESYMFRLINLQSKYTRLNSLKALPQIYKVADLKNISRLKTTEDALVVAIDIFKLILNAIPDKVAKKQQTQSDESGSGAGSGGSGRSYREPEEAEGGGSGSGSGEEGDETDEEETNGGGSGKQSDDENDTDGDGGDMSGDGGEKGDSDGINADASSADGGSDTDSDSPSTASGSTNKSGNSLSNKQKDLLKKKIKKQKDFLKGEIKKSTISKADAETLDIIEQSGAETKVVGEDVKNNYGVPQKGIECIFVKNLTKALMESEDFPLSSRKWQSTTRTYELARVHETQIEEGIRLGTLLGKKLQTRSESRETIFNRQKVGKMDRRMISSLGFGNENVFYSREVDQYKKANLHISLDASGSMNGIKWKQTLTNAVALAKAVDMISNLNIQISIRTTSSNGLPYVVMAYDSRVDKFMKVKTLFPSLTSGGTTPEGLCFEAIRKHIVQSGNDVDSYFLNISDGEPYFEYKSQYNYMGEAAANHTKKMVDEMSNMGIKVLSYFVSESNMGENCSSGRIFRKCYGKSASYINVTNLVQVSTTMNKLFMEK